MRVIAHKEDPPAQNNVCRAGDESELTEGQSSLALSPSPAACTDAACVALRANFSSERRSSHRLDFFTFPPSCATDLASRLAGVFLYFFLPPPPFPGDH